MIIAWLCGLLYKQVARHNSISYKFFFIPMEVIMKLSLWKIMTYEKSDFCCPETHKWFLQTLIKTCEKHKQILKRSSLNILAPYAQWAGYFNFKVPPLPLFYK